eukprot:Pgem_evm1s13026
MKNVAGGGGEVWATDSADEVYKLKVDQSGYPISAFQKQSGTFKQIDVGCDGEVWGISSDMNSIDVVHRYNKLSDVWESVGDIADQISV